MLPDWTVQHMPPDMCATHDIIKDVLNMLFEHAQAQTVLPFMRRTGAYILYQMIVEILFEVSR